MRREIRLYFFVQIGPVESATYAEYINTCIWVPEYLGTVQLHAYAYRYILIGAYIYIYISVRLPECVQQYILLYTICVFLQCCRRAQPPYSYKAINLGSFEFYASMYVYAYLHTCNTCHGAVRLFALADQHPGHLRQTELRGSLSFV